jgi:hypothetical protein
MITDTDSTPKEKRPKTDSFARVILWSAIGAFGFWLVNWLVLDFFFCTVEQRGQFGDRFGMSTSLFGAATIVLLLYTIHLQRKELADGKKEFKQQNRTLKYQKFDNTFFNMLSLQYDIMESSGGMKYLTHFLNTNYIIMSYMYPYDTLKQMYQNKPEGGSALKTKVQDEFGQFVNHFKAIVEFILVNKKLKKSRVKYLRYILPS